MTGSGGEVGRLNTGGGKPVILIVSIYAWQLLVAVVYFFSYVRFYHLICSKYKHLSSMKSHVSTISPSSSSSSSSNAPSKRWLSVFPSLIQIGPLRCWPGGLCLSRSIGDMDVGEFIVPIPHVKQIKVCLFLYSRFSKFFVSKLELQRCAH